MYVITGAAGFIGSCLVQFLNEQGMTNLILVDDFGRYQDKTPNFTHKQFAHLVEREAFFAAWDAGDFSVTGVFHLGARTDTSEQDWSIFEHLNLDYSKAMFRRCAEQEIPFVYASSAATYGGGELGYNDDHEVIEELQPLNPYGRSKNDFDRWVMQQSAFPPAWYGLKFFNIYGPNEYHKGRMASVIFHTYRQLKATGKMKLFRSHRPDIANGHQSRDFVYVKDLCKVMHWLMIKQPNPYGLYNLGTGQARSFLDLARLTFRAAGMEPDISFIDTPADIRDTYQYFTEANMDKLRKAGYTEAFYSLEEGIEEYVQEYLMEGRYY
ncbi:MAG: ADP-glyceromanno-heptose 6-epimerase [Bacteroidota bacterium]